MSKCPLCNQVDRLRSFYKIKNLPLFQNKVYKSRREAEFAHSGDIDLVVCQNCSFVFNLQFDDSLMKYDVNYHNEQAHSAYFRLYLEQISGTIKRLVSKKGLIVEIGCGKGFFLEQLQRQGLNVKGYDPAYEGYNPYIIRDYFGHQSESFTAELIILRHTLEHIGEPLAFLHSIAQKNNYEGKFFIEVPCFKWIIRQKAFWDIFYEHCNYFTKESLSAIFTDSENGPLFNGQYLYLSADLKYLKSEAEPIGGILGLSQVSFNDEQFRYRNFIREHPGLCVWGAGAKGVTFVNLMDPGRQYISAMIDINPKKQNMYIARSGHKIIAPEQLIGIKPSTILIMNNNYRYEIDSEIRRINLKTDLFALGEI